MKEKKKMVGNLFPGILFTLFIQRRGGGGDLIITKNVKVSRSIITPRPIIINCNNLYAPRIIIFKRIILGVFSD